MASQMGKSENMLNVIGHRMDDNPTPILYIGPTQSNIRTVVEPKIMEMIKSVPDLIDNLAKGKKNTKTRKVIGGVAIRMAWAGSATEMAADSAALVILDEVDRMESNVKGEGDPLELGDARTGTYPDGKVGICSTPTLGNVEVLKHIKTGLEHWVPSKEIGSAIWAQWQSGTRHEWAWPCPECREYFIPRLRNLKWDKDSTPQQAEKSARLVCPDCGCLIGDEKKNWMNSRGVFVAPGQSVDQMGKVVGESETEGNTTASFWISGICSFSAKKSFGYLASKMVTAYRSHRPETIQAVINTQFGELFNVAGKAAAWETVRTRCQPYVLGQVPEGVVYITCGVDVQGDRLVYAVRGWGKNFESWLIEAGDLWGKPDAPETWKKLALLLNKKWGNFSINYMGVDSGYETNLVYDFCVNHPGRAIPTMGWEKLTKHYNLKKVKDCSELQRIDFVTDIYKSWVVTRLSWPMEEPGGWWVPTDVTEDYCKQMTSEAKRLKASGGFKWDKLRTNDFFDAEVINRLIVAIASAENEEFFAGTPESVKPRSRVRSKGVR